MKDNNENIIYETVKVNKKRRLIITIAVIITLILSALSVIITLTYTSTKDKGSTDNVSTPLPSSTIGNTFNSETPKATDTTTNSPHASATPDTSYENVFMRRNRERNFDLVVDYLKKAGSLQNDTWNMFLTMEPTVVLTYGYDTMLETETLGVMYMEIDTKNNLSWTQGIEFTRDEQTAIFQTMMIDRGTEDRYKLYSAIEKSTYKGGLGTTIYKDSSDYDYLIQAQAVDMVPRLFREADKSFAKHGLDVTMSELGFWSYDY